MVAGNTAGENSQCLLSAKQRNLGVLEASLPCRYWFQKKGWMDTALFEEWVRGINAEFKAKERKVALIINNCAAHSEKIFYLMLN